MNLDAAHDDSSGASGMVTPTDSALATPSDSRSTSFSGSPYATDPWDLTSFDKLTAFDFLDNLALSQKVEKFNRSLQLQEENLKKRRDKVKKEYEAKKERVLQSVEFEKYKAKYGKDVDKLLEKWSDPQVRRFSSHHKHKLMFRIGCVRSGEAVLRRWCF